MNPMIKYRGGKSKEIYHFISNMPENIINILNLFWRWCFIFLFRTTECNNK